jgi:hypothetical protein
MKILLQELAAAATIEVPHERDWDQVSHVFNKEKFAELIVKECVEVVTDAVDHREPASTYADKIKDHFGVKE